MPLLIAVTVIAAVLLIAFTFVKFLVRRFAYRWVTGIAVNLLFAGYAMLLVSFNTQDTRPFYFQKTSLQPQGYALRITEALHEKEKSFSATASVEALYINNHWQAVTGHIILYFEKNDSVKQLQYGDIIYTQQHPQLVKEPQNPGSFNYKRFLRFHGIYHQLYLKQNAWLSTHQNHAWKIWQIAYNLKAALVKEIKQQIVSPNEVAVCSALLIGFDDYLDQELIDAYSSSGALHVLSVSGLHVGIIFIVLQWLLKWMDKRPVSKAIKNILIILLIWFYALLAGLAPSILRSAVMITMIIIGKWLKRDSYMLNTTLWSAFILLHFNPFMITEVGFQLSYLAVFGIVYLHQRLVLLWNAPNWLLQKTWELTSVSLCAQLMTFPLGLLYFNQFPNLFLISNLLVIPISSLLMIASIIATATIWWQPVSVFFWKISFALAWLMNKIVLTTDSIPFALIKGVWISIGQTWVIYLIIAMALWFLMYKNKTGLFLCFGFSAFLLVWLIVDEINIRTQKQLIVYNIANTTAIDIITGRNHIFITTAELANDKSKLRFNAERKWYQMGIENTVVIPFFQKQPRHSINDFGFAENIYFNSIGVKQQFIQVGNKLIFIPTQWLPKPGAQKINVDYVIITSRFTNKLATLNKVVNAHTIILDASANLKRLLKDTTELSPKYYVVKEQGAFLSEL